MYEEAVSKDGVMQNEIERLLTFKEEDDDG